MGRFYFLFLFLIASGNLYPYNVGLLIMATGKYVSFVEPLIHSAEQFFCKEHNVTYFVFTDGKVRNADNIVTIYQNRLGWPYDTMMRYEVYLKHYDLLSTQDYLYACDADMLFVDDVGDEIIGERVATIHPGMLYWTRGTYETNSKSKACVYSQEGQYYFAGGFYGGSTQEFQKILETNTKNIYDDLSNGIIAVWHDESHWNRYCIDQPPTVILSPSYCFLEQWEIRYPKKLIALDKNQTEFRR